MCGRVVQEDENSKIRVRTGCNRVKCKLDEWKDEDRVGCKADNRSANVNRTKTG